MECPTTSTFQIKLLNGVEAIIIQFRLSHPPNPTHFVYHCNNVLYYTNGRNRLTHIQGKSNGKCQLHCVTMYCLCHILYILYVLEHVCRICWPWNGPRTFYSFHLSAFCVAIAVVVNVVIVIGVIVKIHPIGKLLLVPLSNYCI